MAGDLEALGQTLVFLDDRPNSLPASDGLPPEVREIVRRLAPEAMDRFHTAWEASQALEPLSHEPPPAEAVPVNGASVPNRPIFLSPRPRSRPCDAGPLRRQWLEIEPSAMAVAVAEAVPLEGIAVPVMGTVGLMLDAVPAAEELSWRRNCHR